MDNQQGRLFWLAGLIDGEGNICASYSVPSPKNPRKMVIRLVVQLSMTDKLPIEYACNILRDYGIQHTKFFNKQRKGKWKDVHGWKISGQENIVKFAGVIEDKLILKRELMMLARLYSEKRLEWKKESRNPPYHHSDLVFIEKIRSINHGKQKRTLRDFTPRSQIVI